MSRFLLGFIEGFALGLAKYLPVGAVVVLLLLLIHYIAPDGMP